MAGNHPGINYPGDFLFTNYGSITVCVLKYEYGERKNVMKTKEIINELKKGSYDERLKDVYVDEKLLSYQRSRYIQAVERFIELYGQCEVSIFSAPGRSEVCGNHTDHQKGEILAASINLDAVAIVGTSDDDTVRIVSDGYDEICIDIDDTAFEKSKEGTTEALIKGILAAVKDKGYKTGGFKAYITSDVLIGAGLSSSAAFEVLTGTIISHLFNDGSIDAVTIAAIGQYAENVYFGKPCGLMDQMACSVGNLVHVDFDKPLFDSVEKIDFDLNRYGYCLCITDTKGSHADLTHEYAAIPQEMASVAAYFGKEVLRGITFKDIMMNIADLRRSCSDRAILRAIHVIMENERVEACVKAMRADDPKTFLSCIKESGDSSFKYLQNVFCSSDPSDQSVSLALAVSDALLRDNGVSRVHGGGFAGTIQAFVKEEHVDTYLKGMDRLFGEGACKVLKIRKYGGIRIL